MDIERELTQEEEEHLHGKCHLLAIAFHRLTGLPLAATLDVDMWTERTVLVHAYVMDGENAIDVRSRFDLATIPDDFEVNDHWAVADISEEDLMLLGSRSAQGERKRPCLQEGVGPCGEIDRCLRAPSAAPYSLIWRSYGFGAASVRPKISG